MPPWRSRDHNAGDEGRHQVGRFENPRLQGTEAPKADRDALEAELDGAEASWQMLDFGGRLHSFSEEETKMPGVAADHPGAAHQTYRMLDNFIQDAFAGKL